jgi:hypothetical protein
MQLFHVAGALLLALGSAAQQAVVGYLPEYRLGVVTDDVARFEQRIAPRLTDLVLFSVQPRAKDGRLEGYRLLPLPAALRPGAPARAGGMRLLVSVGGAGRSAGFGAATATGASTAAFAAELAAFVVKHGFDGADIDWEYPATPEQQRGFARLLPAVRAALDEAGGGGGKRLLLTAAVHGVGQPPLDAAAVAALDRVHLMSYDMAGGVDGHAPFGGATAAAEALLRGSAQAGAAPVPAAKLALGMPAYGRALARAGEVKTWGELAREAQPPPKRDVVRGFGATGVDGAARKAAWARERGLAGVMFWEVGQDALPETGPAAAEQTCGAVPGSSCGGADDWSLLLAAHGGDPASPLHGAARAARKAAARAAKRARKARKAARTGGHAAGDEL